MCALDLVRRRVVRRRLAGGAASLVKHRSAHSTDARLGDYALRNTPRHKQHDVLASAPDGRSHRLPTCARHITYCAHALSKTLTRDLTSETLGTLLFGRTVSFVKKFLPSGMPRPRLPTANGGRSA
ncbi:unnamed protein product [Euphydryas editha]|uniref:Uncharacterized protein n=1 Tax=Euphydryas editha TaxID=104508 RepID=A0AAU9TEP5_EUPED|nr:unnamed protein product [Euphydryas editha]